MIVANLLWCIIAFIVIFWVPEVALLTPVVTVIIQIITTSYTKHRSVKNG